MRDLSSNIAPAVSIAPDADRTATTNGSGVDLRDYDSAAVIFHFGAVTDGGWTPSIEESDDNSTFTAVDSSEIVGTLSEAVAASDNTIQKASYIGSKRYIRAVVTESTASTTGAKFSAIVVRGNAAQRPIA